MDLYLQFGYGMMQHCLHLIEEWDGGTVVLSPRDSDWKALERLSKSIRKLKGGRLLFDPQFYLPHANHKTLCKHSYWPQSYETGRFWAGEQLRKLVNDITSYNDDLQISDIILPGMYGEVIEEIWLDGHKTVCEVFREINPKRILIATIAISSEATKSTDQIDLLLDSAQNWPVDGFYVIFEHPRYNYLADDPVWMSHSLDLIAGLKLMQKFVMVGYANQQFLIAACAATNAICSGTFMNVRSFSTGKFNNAMADDRKQKSTWYYCPQTLSEYQIRYLDIAHDLGVLDRLRPSERYRNRYSEPLFSGHVPSAANFDEPTSFRHYLTCLRLQAEDVSAKSFADTTERYDALLKTAEENIAALAREGIEDKKRSFSDIIPPNRAALRMLEKRRGPLLKRKWGQI